MSFTHAWTRPLGGAGEGEGEGEDATPAFLVSAGVDLAPSLVSAGVDLASVFLVSAGVDLAPAFLVAAGVDLAPAFFVAAGVGAIAGVGLGTALCAVTVGAWLAVGTAACESE